ncbi:hypothetical protein, partial [Roseibium sp. RKSG952]|uniref:hypothetical protein n=1 Tax=Roseibium sp. RKSG952 TaxID=2529384 RepID=UPI001AD8A26D
MTYLVVSYGDRLHALLSRQLGADAPKTPASAAAYVMGFDPTMNKEYSKWMARSLLRGGFLAEDLPKARGTLELFSKYRT